MRALAGSSDWRRRLLDRFGSCIVSVAGTSALAPAPSPGWPDASWEELDDELRGTLPGLRLIGAVSPRQPGRERLSLLGHMTGNPVVVKLGRDEPGGDSGLDRELRALELLAGDPLPGIATPEPLDAGALRLADSAVDYLVTTSIALHRQRPAVDEPLRSFESDLGSRLNALSRTGTDADHDSDLVPVHGDLTPWNLRRTPRGLALFDWEAAGWGAPGSDIALYRTASDSIRRPWAKRARGRAS
ncbi:MAG: phosphotransferase [Ilumatobacter sp.]|uniref:phosphotransferase n=1 Tax=Ilumatobacter sp. TaxID=1967498 RepID=UPI0032982FF8